MKRLTHTSSWDSGRAAVRTLELRQHLAERPRLNAELLSPSASVPASRGDRLGDCGSLDDESPSLAGVRVTEPSDDVGVSAGHPCEPRGVLSPRRGAAHRGRGARITMSFRGELLRD